MTSSGLPFGLTGDIDRWVLHRLKELMPRTQEDCQRREGLANDDDSDHRSKNEEMATNDFISILNEAFDKTVKKFKKCNE